MNEMNLIVFLNARLREDEEAVNKSANPARALREVEFKRTILDRYIKATESRVHSYDTTFTGAHHATLEDTVVAIAAIYYGHADYSSTWFEEEEE